MGAITRAWAGGEGGISGINKAGVGGWGQAGVGVSSGGGRAPRAVEARMVQVGTGSWSGAGRSQGGPRKGLVNLSGAGHRASCNPLSCVCMWTWGEDAWGVCSPSWHLPTCFSRREGSFLLNIHDFAWFSSFFLKIRFFFGCAGFHCCEGFFP